MCGFDGIFKLDHTRVDLEDIKKMSSVIAHRGPDDAGYAVLNNASVGLGHLRLSIIDLKHGHQPMYNEDRSICMVYNGEIYDHVELRKDLQSKGHKFRTTSDSEVIIHLYQEYGLDFFSKLNGEFAFAIWDQKNKRLIAARDRMGIKPLYYHKTRNEIIFASESKAILALQRVDRDLSKDYLTGAFMGAFPRSFSAFQGIQSVKPGHYLMAGENEIPKEYEYWTQKYEPDEKMTFDDAKEKVRELFTKAVQRRMVADVEVGTYLSGGLDSTLVSAIMAGRGERFKAFNIGFGGSVYDEASLARKIAQYYGMQFETMNCTMDMMAEDFEKTIYHVETAVANPHAIAKELLSKLVRSQGHKVCITGEGSDEVFGGYAYFKLENIWRMMQAGGAQAAEAQELWEKFQIIEKRSEGVLWDRSQHWRKVEQIFGYPNYQQVRADESSPFVARIFETEKLGITKDDNPLSHFRRNFDAGYLRSLDPFNATRKITLNQLGGYVIPALGDRVEMANSVECRTPFLDRDILDFTGTVPPRHFMDIKNLKEKHLLKEAFKGVLPAFMENEHKHPFLSPDWRQFSKTRRGKEIFAEHLSSSAIKKAGIFKPSFVRRLKVLWAVLPQNSVTRKKVDVLMGSMLGVQMLNHLFVEKTVQGNADFKMVNRSPDSPQLTERAFLEASP